MFSQTERDREPYGYSSSFRRRDGVVIGHLWLTRDPESEAPGFVAVRSFNMREGTQSPAHLLKFDKTYLVEEVPDTMIRIYRGKTQTQIVTQAPDNVPVLREKVFIEECLKKD